MTLSALLLNFNFIDTEVHVYLSLKNPLSFDLAPLNSSIMSNFKPVAVQAGAGRCGCYYLSIQLTKVVLDLLAPYPSVSGDLFNVTLQFKNLRYQHADFSLVF